MTAKTDISKCLSSLFGKLKLCIVLSFIVLCLLQPTANYDLAIIEDYLAGNSKIIISIKKQNGVVVIFGKPWQLLLTGSAVPRIMSFVMPWLIESMVCVYLSQPPAEYINFTASIKGGVCVVVVGGRGVIENILLASPQETLPINTITNVFMDKIGKYRHFQSKLKVHI